MGQEFWSGLVRVVLARDLSSGLGQDVGWDRNYMKTWLSLEDPDLRCCTHIAVTSVLSGGRSPPHRLVHRSPSVSSQHNNKWAPERARQKPWRLFQLNPRSHTSSFSQIIIDKPCLVYSTHTRMWIPTDNHHWGPPWSADTKTTLSVAGWPLNSLPSCLWGSLFHTLPDLLNM